MPEAPSTTQRHVFVYGTLRRGDDNDITRLKPEPVFVGSAAIAGTLYDLGAYPGIQLGGEGLVHGEVYAIALELKSSSMKLKSSIPSSGTNISSESSPWRCRSARLRASCTKSIPSMWSGAPSFQAVTGRESAV